jgi:hypothetical protein
LSFLNFCKNKQKPDRCWCSFSFCFPSSLLQQLLCTNIVFHFNTQYKIRVFVFAIKKIDLDF